MQSISCRYFSAAPKSQHLSPQLRNKLRALIREPGRPKSRRSTRKGNSMRLILLVAALTAVGCGSGTGQIMVTMTDAPVSDANVKNVFVTYDELRIHSEATQNAADEIGRASCRERV